MSGSGIRVGQLWVSPEPLTYYVKEVREDGTVLVTPVRIVGKGRGAKIVAMHHPEVRLETRVAEMLDTWMPTAHDPGPPPTSFERILRDEED